MRPKSAMSRHENDMMNKSQRILAAGRVEDAVEKLRHLCLARGATGILGLGRCFRRMDDNGDKALSLEEFIKGLNDTGLTLTTEEATEVYESKLFIKRGVVNLELLEFSVNHPSEIIKSFFKKKSI